MAKILVVDDDVDNRLIIKTVLENANHSVSESVDGKLGIELALNEKFDLIILDVMMPKIDGWQVCETLKSDLKTKDIPILILTARTTFLDEIQRRGSRADEYLTKLADHKTLLETVEKLLSKKTP